MADLMNLLSGGLRGMGVSSIPGNFGLPPGFTPAPPQRPVGGFTPVPIEKLKALIMAEQEQKMNEAIIMKRAEEQMANEGFSRSQGGADILANTSPEEQPVADAIKKGMTEDEFVNNIGKTLYHGGSRLDKIGNIRSKWGAFYMTENPDYAKSYGGEKSVVNNIVLSKDAKIADLINPSDELVSQIGQMIRGRTTGKTITIKKPDGSYIGVPEVVDAPNLGSYTANQVIDGIRNGKAHIAELPAIKDALKKLGYDGILTKESNAGNNYGIWNKNVVNIESDLRTRYRQTKAQLSGGMSSEEQAVADAIRKGVDENTFVRSNFRIRKSSENGRVNIETLNGDIIGDIPSSRVSSAKDYFKDYPLELLPEYDVNKLRTIYRSVKEKMGGAK
ncbi:hypothetical protein EOM86_06910 [Candidatus Nomurabacteria bacterium]|nr:hypothetical protein [Candidatus Nomurabacteria bacterium]